MISDFGNLDPRDYVGKIPVWLIEDMQRNADLHKKMIEKKAYLNGPNDAHRELLKKPEKSNVSFGRGQGSNKFKSYLNFQKELSRGHTVSKDIRAAYSK